MIMIEYMKGKWKMTENMGRVGKSLIIEVFIKDNSSMGSRKDLACSLGPMERFMKVNGLMGLRMDQEFGKATKKIAIWANGKKGSLMVMEYMYGSMEINMKVNSRTL